MTILITIKTGICGVTFTWYLNRHFEKKHFIAGVFGIFYALSGYMAAYSWNIMWLDCIWLLPLILYGAEQLVREKKGLFYCITLGPVSYTHLHAIEGETRRQIELIEDGRKVIQETRRWDDNKESSKAMRSKEDAQDYRYFPDPDLTPVVISDEWIARIRAAQPELRTEKMARYISEFDLPQYDAQILTNSKHMADVFEETVKLCGKPKEASNWLMVEAMRLLKEHEMDPDDMGFSPANLAKLIQMVAAGEINRTVAKTVFEEIFEHNVDPAVYVEEKGLKVVNDEGALKATIEGILAANPQSVADYKGGKEKAMGFLVCLLYTSRCV